MWQEREKRGFKKKKADKPLQFQLIPTLCFTHPTIPIVVLLHLQIDVCEFEGDSAPTSYSCHWSGRNRTRQDAIPSVFHLEFRQLWWWSHWALVL